MLSTPRLSTGTPTDLSSEASGPSFNLSDTEDEDEKDEKGKRYEVESEAGMKPGRPIRTKMRMGVIWPMEMRTRTTIKAGLNGRVRGDSRIIAYTPLI